MMIIMMIMCYITEGQSQISSETVSPGASNATHNKDNKDTDNVDDTLLSSAESSGITMDLMLLSNIQL